MRFAYSFFSVALPLTHVCLSAPVDKLDPSTTTYPHLPDGYMSPSLDPSPPPVNYNQEDNCGASTYELLPHLSPEEKALLDDWFKRRSSEGYLTSFHLTPDSCAIDCMLENVHRYNFTDSNSTRVCSSISKVARWWEKYVRPCYEAQGGRYVIPQEYRAWDLIQRSCEDFPPADSSSSTIPSPSTDAYDSDTDLYDSDEERNSKIEEVARTVTEFITKWPPKTSFLAAAHAERRVVRRGQISPDGSVPLIPGNIKANTNINTD